MVILHTLCRLLWKRSCLGHREAYRCRAVCKRLAEMIRRRFAWGNQWLLACVRWKHLCLRQSCCTEHEEQKVRWESHLVKLVLLVWRKVWSLKKRRKEDCMWVSLKSSRSWILFEKQSSVLFLTGWFGWTHGRNMCCRCDKINGVGNFSWKLVSFGTKTMQSVSSSSMVKLLVLGSTA